MTFVRNTWYMAGWSKDLSSPVARTILNTPIVLFRASSGEIGALHDVCPHRAVPLSLGKVSGNHIVCPYHGLEFDTGGVCRRNPHVKGPSHAIKARDFRAIDRHGIIWIWMGIEAQANPDAIPDYSWFNSPDQFATGTGYLHIDADYRLIIDNLMDLAHADYIHPHTVGSPGAAEVQQAEVVREGDTISVNALWPDLPPNAINKQFWTRTPHVDQYLDMKWHRASSMLLNLGIMAPGEPRESGLHTPSAHILTPETERSTHYFWAFARDFDKSNTRLTETIVEVVGAAFTREDKPMIEAAQRNLDRGVAKLLNFTVGDSGSARVRRELERLAALEAGESP